MSDAKVTRAHREAAITALMMGVSEETIAFEETGTTCDQEYLAEALRVARGFAEFEARGAAAARLVWGMEADRLREALYALKGGEHVKGAGDV